jgi:hypothetical protein
MRGRSFPVLGTLTAIRNRPVTTGIVGVVADDVAVTKTTEEVVVVGALEEAADVIFETIERLLSIEWGSPNTTVVVV